MGRTFAGLGILCFVAAATFVLGGALLNRRWDREGFYE